MKRRTIAAFALLFAGALYSQEYTKDGGLALPDYRKWVFLSSGLGMTYGDTQPKNPAFTNVFAEPAAYEQFMKNGVWPDKTVLVLEIRGSESATSINKSGFVQAQRVGVEVEVKDASKGGWSFYGFPGGAGPGTLFPKTAECYSCHAQHGATDNTFVQFYPALAELAKKKGTYAPK